jgi:hypothetical protein
MTTHSPSSACLECGAKNEPGTTCTESFHQMLFWEAEHPDFAAQVHHLMVLAYHLQHPSLYSPDGLQYAIDLLIDFHVRGLPPEHVRQRGRARVDSSRRKWKIRASPGMTGAYPQPVTWTYTTADVIAAGLEAYPASVRQWTETIYQDLRHAGCL